MNSRNDDFVHIFCSLWSEGFAFDVIKDPTANELSRASFHSNMHVVFKSAVTAVLLNASRQYCRQGD
jgi:hypothetical protein